VLFDLDRADRQLGRQRSVEPDAADLEIGEGKIRLDRKVKQLTVAITVRRGKIEPRVIGQPGNPAGEAVVDEVTRKTSGLDRSLRLEAKTRKLLPSLAI